MSKVTVTSEEMHAATIVLHQNGVTCREIAAKNFKEKRSAEVKKASGCLVECQSTYISAQNTPMDEEMDQNDLQTVQGYDNNLHIYQHDGAPCHMEI